MDAEPWIRILRVEARIHCRPAAGPSAQYPYDFQCTRQLEKNLCQRIGFTGPSNAFTEQGCMHHAMCIFLGYFNEYLKDRTRRRGVRMARSLQCLSIMRRL